jgi:hypothetical protein
LLLQRELGNLKFIEFLVSLGLRGYYVEKAALEDGAIVLSKGRYGILGVLEL